MRAVNLDTYSLSLLTAKEDILNPRSSTNWALFTYDGVTNNLKLTDSGAGGLVELAGKFHTAKPQYGLCRAASSESGTPIVALISWMGKDVAEFRRTECASHVPAIRNFFKEAQVFLGAEKAEDVMEEKISAEFSKVQPPAEKSRRSSRSLDKEETVGTNYRKTNAALEMRRINRDSFWARAEREEEQRKEEERRRAAEERRRLERERVTKERSEAEERERKMDEKLQRIEEQRRRQAELEEGMRKQEKARWETQQREHEEDMRARLRHSESIEKAAEAAALVSQRSINPREFFRQLSSNSSQSPSSPNSPRTGKPPLRRYQRSLTDSGYTFGRMDGPTSPRSPTLVSPFFRAPPSPLLRPISPASSTFHPFTYPVRPKAPIMSPPASPLRPTPPPVSALPTLPSASSNSRAKGALSPQPSAPPASPGFLSSLSPGYPPDRPPQAMPPTPPDSPLQGQARAPALGSLPRESPTHLQPESSTTCPVSPETTSDTTAHNREQYMATFVHTEMGLEAGYTAQAVLVEEEDEVEEEVEEADKAKPEPCMDLTQPSQTAMVMEGETAEKLNILGEDPLATIPEGGGAELDRQARDQSNCAMAPAKLSAELSEEEEELFFEDLKQGIPHQITQDVVIRATNGLTNGEDLLGHNGTEGSVSLSDTGSSPPELASSCDMHSKVEDCIIEYEQEDLCENGKEVLPERQLCVRALYDYQAEDETEISFEPGDIISDVETVDNAWWRGYSKDGRQGLFPANYVETI